MLKLVQYYQTDYISRIFQNNLAQKTQPFGDGTTMRTCLNLNLSFLRDLTNWCLDY